jgi:hypothetical protein
MSRIVSLCHGRVDHEVALIAVSQATRPDQFERRDWADAVERAVNRSQGQTSVRTS